MNIEHGENIEEFVNENIHLLLTEENYCLHKSLLKEDINLAQEFGFQSILDLMIHYKLIEFNSNPYILHLTSHGFEYEEKYWFFPIYRNELHKIESEENKKQNDAINNNTIVRILKLIFVLTIVLLFIFLRKPIESTKKILK